VAWWSPDGERKNMVKAKRPSWYTRTTIDFLTLLDTEQIQHPDHQNTSRVLYLWHYFIQVFPFGLEYPALQTHCVGEMLGIGEFELDGQRWALGAGCRTAHAVGRTKDCNVSTGWSGVRMRSLWVCRARQWVMSVVSRGSGARLIGDLSLNAVLHRTCHTENKNSENDVRPYSRWVCKLDKCV